MSTTVNFPLFDFNFSGSIEGDSTDGLVLRGYYMARFNSTVLKLWNNVRGQDMIEYALLAAALAVVVAGFLPPQIMPAVSTIFSKVVSGFNAS
jgi:Flp pilus assembly pilin Flp